MELYYFGCLCENQSGGLVISFALKLRCSIEASSVVARWLCFTGTGTGKREAKSKVRAKGTGPASASGGANSN